MVTNELKERTHKLVQEARKKGLIKSYSDFCKTKEAKEYALTKEEIAYCISKKEENK